MPRCFIHLALLCLVVSSWQAGGQTRRALLIGINLYQPPGTTATRPAGCKSGRCELPQFTNLDGSVNDAEAMADLLTSPKFGFPAANVVLLTNPGPVNARPGVAILPADQTTRDGILAAMKKYLVDVPQRGDTVVFYDASHGSLRVNSKGTKLAVWAEGKLVHADNTLVPSDAYKGGFDIRDREMTRIFNAALDKGIHLTVIFDSCHSGGVARGIGLKYRERSLAYDPRDINEAPDKGPDDKEMTAPTERTDNAALVFSAAQQDQSAKESPPPDTAKEPHGAFTAALIEALQVLPADAPASVVYERVRAVLEGSGVSDEDPDLDAKGSRRQEPLFGGKAAKNDRVLAAAIKMDDDGLVWLDIGQASGIGPGTEFTSTEATGGTDAVTIRVKDLAGIARSSSVIVSPPGGKVEAGTLFALSKLVPPKSDPLLFWQWPATLSQEEIANAIQEVKAAGVVSVGDPAEEFYTHILSWDGSSWVLQQAKPQVVARTDGTNAANLDNAAPAAAKLGPKLTAAALKQKLNKDARVWVNLPAPREIADKLALHDPQSAVQSAQSVADASYLLTGVLTENGPAYAWFHKSEFAAGPRTVITKDHSPGCSTTSPYPVRTDWTRVDAAQTDELTKKLNDYALRLSKVHGWLTLQDSANGSSGAEFYSLALVRANDGSPLPRDQAAQQGDRIQLALRSDDMVVGSRWVYVLDIDCHGAGSLLYPSNYLENKFPNAGANQNKFVLPHSGTLHIGPPYGVETLILLSTEEPLPDPYVLNFEGVASRGGARGVETPLARLLSDRSSGTTRGLEGDVPTDWGMSMMHVRSVPKEGAQ